MRVGLISDTHGYLDPRVLPAFAGVGLILHAGDVGRADVLAALERLAPVHAVQGNNDGALVALGLPLRLDIVLGGVAVHLVHRLVEAQPPPGTGILVYGHSHRAVIDRRGDVLYVNPGAAGRAGFHREQTVAILEINEGAAQARLVLLGPREKSARVRPMRG